MLQLELPNSPPAKRIYAKNECADCGELLGLNQMIVCDACMDRRETALKAQGRDEVHQRKVSRWLEICPDIYRSTNWSRPDLYPAISPVCRQWASDWKVEKGNGMGLGLYGLTGRGKTRCMYAILQRCHFAGLRVAAVPSTRIEEAAAGGFTNDAAKRAEARHVLALARTVPVLLIDDMGMEVMTERVSKECYAIWEDRTSNRRPTLWTSNITGVELEAKLGPRGAATIRRIREFSEIYEAI